MVLLEKRTKFQTISFLIGKTFSRILKNPNHWTFLSLILAFLGFVFLIKNSFLLAGIFFLLSGVMDVIDGSVARYLHRSSRKGAYLDTVIDRYSDFLMLLGFLFLDLPEILFPSSFWVFFCLFGVMLTTYSKAAAKEKDLIENEIRGGFLERPERVLILSTATVFGEMSLQILTWTLIFLGILSNITALQRIFKTLRS